MDLILSEEPSTDAHVLELELAEVEVDPLVDVQPGKVFSMSTLGAHFCRKYENTKIWIQIPYFTMLD
jgi:hypothetical protein